MDLTEIKKTLEQLFDKQPRVGAKRNIIFWYDDNGIFVEDIDSLNLENVKLIKVDNNSMFATKLYIERTDQENNLLVYSAMARPDNLENWLTDTIKYSCEFFTDEVSLILLNFNMDISLKGIASKYKKFFLKYKAGIKKFESYNITMYTEDKIHIGVLSALCKLQTPSFDNVVRTLITELATGENTLWNSITMYGDIDVFWKLVNNYYGYSLEEKSLESLATVLLCSHLAQTIKTDLPKEWTSFVSQDPNCYWLVDGFMKNIDYIDNYSSVASLVAKKLDLEDVIRTWTLDEITDCYTFSYFDSQLIIRIRENISLKSSEYGFYKKIISSRRNCRYYKDFESEYSVLISACEYFELEILYKDLKGTNTLDVFNNYVKNYYKIDTAYRHFIATYDGLGDVSDYNIIFEMVENSYTNWFLSELTMKWNSFWDDENSWRLDGVISQQDFFSNYGYKFVQDNARIIIIISDGLRYESAVELNSILNRERNGESNIDAMLGVIPSHTSLGMASLLPRKSMTQIIIRDNATYEIEGISIEGTENRGKILEIVKKESLALKYDDIQHMGNVELQNKLHGIKLVYVYHNTIDAEGDKASTEDKVFKATDEALKELSLLVRKFCNVGSTYITITSDHGFIYRRTKLEEHEKIPRTDAVELTSGRRFLISRESIELQGTQSFTMDYLTKEHKGMTAILPRNVNCFKIQGPGNRYVHGGSSLQEVTIPVITFKNFRTQKPLKVLKK